MKNILKITLMLLLVFTLGCEDDDSSRFRDEPSSGWVDFRSSTGTATIVLQATELEIPLNIKVPVFPNGLNIGYTLEPVSGNFAPYVNTSGNVYVSPDNLTRTASVLLEFEDLTQLQEQLIFDVVLTSVDAPGVTIGVDETSVTRFRVSTPCPSVYSANYNVDVTALGSTAPSHSVALTPVAGTDNQFTVTSTWGPNFVGWATNNSGLNGQYLYSGTITVNDDLTVGVIGNDAWATGGTGSYDPCLDQFTITLTQGLFTTSFTVDIVMTPN